MFEIKDFGFGVYVLLPSNFIEAYFSPFFLAHVQIFPQTNLVSYFFLFVAILFFPFAVILLRLLFGNLFEIYETNNFLDTSQQ